MIDSVLYNFKEKMTESNDILALFTGFRKMPAGIIFNFIGLNLLI